MVCILCVEHLNNMLIDVTSVILQSDFVADPLLHLYTHENIALPDILSGLILINRATLC